MRGNETLFGVNFADGRIKGYPIFLRGAKVFFVNYVRGNPAYGKNRFRDNGDGTVTDDATGLTWMKADSGKGLDWCDALEYAEDLELAGHTDWRLPNAKELQSILDYTRSPDTTDSAAINPIFDATEIENEGGNKDFGWYWTGTTHRQVRGSRNAVYIAFGRGGGFMQDRRTGDYRLLDVHGAGAQRSDPKAGNASRDGHGRGSQGDVVRIENLVRCVRGGDVEIVRKGPELEKRPQQGPRGGGPGRQGQQADEGRSGPGQRGGGGPPRGPEDFLNRFDTNKDGQVSKEEFTGPANRFPMLDQDGDGIITRKEMESIPQRAGRGGGRGSQGQQDAGRKGASGRGRGQQDVRAGQQGGPDRQGPQAGGRKAALSDGGGLPGESNAQMTGNRKQQGKSGGGIDRQGQQDGGARSTRSEGGNGQRGGSSGQQQGGSGPIRGPEDFLNRHDSDKDGQVTKEEFTGPAPRFSTWDQDGDGIVSRKEMDSKPKRAGRGGAAASGPVVPPKLDRDAQVDTIRSPKPNIVFILADDMGWTGTSVQIDDRVPESMSDYYQTPHLERLAKQGIRFSQAYSPGAQCTPTRAAILTGRTPAALHVTTPGGGRSQTPRKLLTPSQPSIKIQPGETTIAEALKEAGYAAAHLGKWHMGENNGPGENGFDVHDGTTENSGPGVLEDPNPKDIFGITARALDFMTAHAWT